MTIELTSKESWIGSLHHLAKKDGVHQQFVGAVPKGPKIGIVRKRDYPSLA